MSEDEEAAPRPILRSLRSIEITSWGAGRQTVHSIVNNSFFDMGIGAAIMVNLIILLVEVDQRAECYPSECPVVVIGVLNRILLGVYTVEAFMRAYVQRSQYLKDTWNILDGSLVISGYFDEIMSTLVDGGGALAILPVLRIFRVLRFLRAIRLLRFFPELYVMIRGFFFAMKAMAWGLLLILCLLCVWSAFFLELFNPINKSMIAELRQQGADFNEDCEQVFGSLFDCLLFMFQTLVAGDSWGACAIPLIRHERWTFIFFAMALVSVSLGLMNLILAIIVDNANAARESDKEGMLRVKKQQKVETIEKWRSVIKLFDENDDGQITYKEMMAGFHTREIHEVLEVMGIEQDDLQHMFKLMDMDDSGDLQYDEFISSFLKAQGQEPSVYLMMMRLETNRCLKVLLDLSERINTAKLTNEVQEQGAPVRTKTCECRPRGEAPEGLNLEKDVPLGIGSIASTAAPLADDFGKFSASLQAQFEALAQRIELSLATQCGQVSPAALYPVIARGGPPLEHPGGYHKAFEEAAQWQLDRTPPDQAGLSSSPLRAPHRPPDPALALGSPSPR